jgi:hypothetical protein
MKTPRRASLPLSTRGGLRALALGTTVTTAVNLQVAPAQGDFTLQPESPAFALGFQPVDLGQLGPRVEPGPRTVE